MRDSTDDLLGVEPAHAVAVGIECLELMMAARPEGSDLDGLLTLPLDSASGWEGVATSMDDLLAETWIYGPGRSVPGLYLVHPLHWRLLEEVEEHKVPLEGHSLPHGWQAYYRAWRTQGEPEFNRAVYIRTPPT
jgi:hypothetical protein